MYFIFFQDENNDHCESNGDIGINTGINGNAVNDDVSKLYLKIILSVSLEEAVNGETCRHIYPINDYLCNSCAVCILTIQNINLFSVNILDVVENKIKIYKIFCQ